jgi:TolA-binding protein
MSETKRSYAAVLGALSVILIGLFLVCAQQRGAVSEGSDMTADDAQFKQELLEMLDMAQDQKQTKSDTSAAVFKENKGDSTSDVLSLLTSEDTTKAASVSKPVTPTPAIEDTTTSAEEPLFFAEEPAAEPAPVPAAESAPAAEPAVTAKASETTKNANELNKEMLTQAKEEVDRLEKLYDHRSGAADSLRRIIENRTGRIKDLELHLSAIASTSDNQKSTRRASSSSKVVQDPAFVAAYESARDKFEHFDYQGAIDALQSLLKQNPNNPLADNCQYWIGECYFGLKQFQTAIIEFQKVFAYVQNDKYDDAQLMIAQAYNRMGQKDRARVEFETFINNYIDSEYLPIAKRKMENI